MTAKKVTFTWEDGHQEEHQGVRLTTEPHQYRLDFPEEGDMLLVPKQGVRTVRIRHLPGNS